MQNEHIDIKNHTFYFFEDMINIKNLDPNKIRIDKKSYSYLLHCIRKIKDLKYVINHSVKLLYFILTKINGYTEESNGNKCFTLVPTNENRKIVKIYEELWVQNKRSN